MHIPGVTNIAPDHLSRIYADHKWGEGRGAHFLQETAAHATDAPNPTHTNTVRAGSARRVTFKETDSEARANEDVPVVRAGSTRRITLTTDTPSPPVSLFALSAPSVTPQQRDHIGHLRAPQNRRAPLAWYAVACHGRNRRVPCV
jgi:hypothetical protein